MKNKFKNSYLIAAIIYSLLLSSSSYANKTENNVRCEWLHCTFLDSPNTAQQKNVYQFFLSSHLEKTQLPQKKYFLLHSHHENEVEPNQYFFRNFANKISADDLELLLKDKFAIGPKKELKPFFSLSKLSVFNTIDMPLQNKFDLATDLNSTLANFNDWLERVIIGIESHPFLANFTASAGVGAAIINQTLAGKMGATDLTTTNNNQTYFRPAASASITWNACPSCIAGHGLSISAQVAADQYPSSNISGITPAGNHFNFSADQSWQMSEMLVLDMDI